MNSKVYSITKVSLFIANYERELMIRADIRRKGKVENMTEFVERMKKNLKGSRSGTEKDIRGNKETGG